MSKNANNDVSKDSPIMMSLLDLFVFLLFLFCFLIEISLLREVKISTAFFLYFYFSGVQENDSELIDISKLDWPEQENVRKAFVRSGFADDRSGEYKLRPCLLGTFADISLTNPKCKKCSAGKL